MIHPDENKPKQIWDGLILLLTIFAAIEIPLRIVLNYHAQGFLLFFDWFITICFFTDVMLNFVTSIYLNGKLVSDRKIVAKNYLRGWFLIDFLASLPLDMLLSGSFGMLTDAARMFRLLRLFRLARLAQFMQKLARSNMINISVLRMVFLAFWVLMIMHWTACGWLLMGGGNIAGLELSMGNIPEAKIELIDPYRLYIRCLYWAVTTIATIGYGDITPQTNGQTLYAMAIELIGAGMYGYVIGVVASLLANIDVARAQYMEKMEKINTFMKYRQIPSNLQDSIRNYYSYLWESRRGYDESQVISDLPSSLKLNVSLYLNREIIEKVPLFRGASDDFIRQIVINLRPAVYTPGDYIFRKGEVGSTMFFISRGAVEVVSEDGKTVFATLSEGNFFGEIALLMNMPRTASIRAVDFCDLYTLDQETFNRILKDFPAFSVHIREFARKRQEESQVDQQPEANSEIIAETDQVPPGRVSGMSIIKEDAGSIFLSWHSGDGASVYQVTRYDPDSNHWKLLNGFVQSTIYRDVQPYRDKHNVYRVRGVNEAGAGDWSETISIHF